MQDISGIAPRNPFAPLGESMHAGNTISSAANGLSGSVSEATANIPQGRPPLDLSNPGSYHNQLAEASADHPAHLWTDVHHAGDPNWIPPTSYPDR